MSIINIESKGQELIRKHIKKGKSIDQEPIQNKSSALPDWITGLDPLYTYEVESRLMENGVNHRRLFRKVRIHQETPIVATKKKDKPFFIKID